ncbi:hemolysin D [Novosphingobium marinum]|uniref:RND family efflux transporter MFP subunit n=1 Tax=Novosphingobium marinum TaxID=1514948 RepID=A0A7Y9XSJ9_9SPHN|nr:efflux RND transporter periplasmic adaptor subunit [Novosphingobium marinum]NYH93791.1 RND family efflux transporter MFP subunit [Novosphingobium marinum]GGC17300.1 hemolysin D [Novosphingobium marinum]
MLKRLAPAAALSLLLAGGCSSEERSREDEAVPIVAQQLRVLPERERVEAVGTARAATSAEIYPESAGRVEQVMFSAGNFVRQGTPLVRLDSRRERLAVEAARVQVQEASQLLSRYRRIEDTGAISESQIEAGETALASARVELQQAQTALADRTIRAPFSGHIGLTEIDPGDRVDTATPIAQIDRRSTLYVDFPAPESAFERLQPGQVVAVTPFSDPSREIDARIIAVDSAISEEERTFTVRAAIENSGDTLRPGMSFRVVFSGAGQARPAVPEEAIVWGGDGSYLWAVRDGKAARVPITITSRREGLAFVDAPLNPRDTIVVEGVQKLREGQDVRIAKPPGKAAAKAPGKAGNADGE